jgi:hypothetical protein
MNIQKFGLAAKIQTSIHYKHYHNVYSQYTINKISTSSFFMHELYCKLKTLRHKEQFIRTNRTLILVCGSRVDYEQ